MIITLNLTRYMSLCRTRTVVCVSGVRGDETIEDGDFREVNKTASVLTALLDIPVAPEYVSVAVSTDPILDGIRLSLVRSRPYRREYQVQGSEDLVWLCNQGLEEALVAIPDNIWGRRLNNKTTK